MRLEQLAAVLQTAGLGTPGQSIFVHYMPAQTVVGMVLLPSLAGDPINWELGQNWRNAHAFQLLVRDPVIIDGYERAKAATNAITFLQETTLAAIPPDIPAVDVRFIRPKHDVIVYPRSPASYFEFSVNFEAAFSIQQ